MKLEMSPYDVEKARIVFRLDSRSRSTLPATARPRPAEEGDSAAAEKEEIEGTPDFLPG